MTASAAPQRKTYSRLTSGRRLPTEYELVSTDLHYNYPDQFELRTPVTEWYLHHREGSRLQAANWDAFADPRRTTYRGYTELQDRKEDVVDALLREIDETDYDNRLGDGWVEFLDRWYAPLRFPVHGLQMLAAYVAQMAPSSRVTNCAAFQAADELRRVQRIAYRTAQLATHNAAIDIDGHRHHWENAEAFQPLRELIERALVTYDWGNALVVTNVVIKPLFDRVINTELAGALAQAHGDSVLQHMHFSLDEDARWHRAWSWTLLRASIDDRPENKDVVDEWIHHWRPLARDALEALASVMTTAPKPADGERVVENVANAAGQETAALLEPPPTPTSLDG